MAFLWGHSAFSFYVLGYAEIMWTYYKSHFHSSMPVSYTHLFPMYAVAFTPILISRFLLGAGIGLFNSLAVSLIPQFYVDDEEELASMLGFQNVMSSIGAAVSSFLVSYLVTISWHAAFVIYFLVIPSLRCV